MTALEPNVATTLSDTISGSGIKDLFAQPIIERLIKLGQQLRKGSGDGSTLSPSDVLTNLTEELKAIHASSGAVMNPLLHMPGMDHNSRCIIGRNTVIQVSIFTKIRLQRYFTQFFLAL